MHERILTCVGKEACPFLYDIIRGVRIEKGVFLHGIEEVSSLWRGAIILTIASFVTKVLSAFYRIPYQNIAGDVGFIFTNKFIHFMDFV